ncbi:alkaline phosphatase family protein [Corallococcus sp. EGB]|uniref:alkaline phosphatase family protein n=1 Tax=Corallococcus sp. EGB TaxID=1521117 RepID=UPI001CBB2847|nr:alkaline phosphatase family protein [Corallococcus sp. EGB]
MRESLNELVSENSRNWANTLVRRIGTKVPPVAARRPRNALLVHLDGVPKALLDEAIMNGRMPFVSRLIRSGAYHLDNAFWGAPTSTPFFQAGLLYGLRHPNLPGYSWYDRTLGRKVQMNAPADAMAIDARLRGHGRTSLLDQGGHTYFSLFHAGAMNRMCMSTLSSFKLMARSFAYEIQGLGAARTRSAWDFVRSFGMESWQAVREVRQWADALKDWRHEHGFLLSRILLQRLGWSFAYTKSLVDMVRGVPLIYLVYGNYDEVAHRRGPRSKLAMEELYRVDASLAGLYAVARAAPVPYDVILLSDHGHVDSLPLEQRQGRRLEAVLFEGEVPPLQDDVLRGLLDGRAPPAPDTGAHEPFTPVVVEAGNFAHIYLSGRPTPMEARELLARHPEVLARAASNPDIGMVAMRRGAEAVVVMGGGVYGPADLDRAPLSSEYSRHAVAEFLHGLPRMDTAGDLVLFGEAIQRGGTVGFAWEFGSHGGLTRVESDSLVLWPASGPVDLSGLSHCARLHERLAEAYLDTGPLRILH